MTDYEVRAWAEILLKDLQADLGEDAYNAAWERGKSLDLGTVVQELLAEAPDQD